MTSVPARKQQLSKSITTSTIINKPGHYKRLRSPPLSLVHSRHHRYLIRLQLVFFYVWNHYFPSVFPSCAREHRQDDQVTKLRTPKGVMGKTKAAWLPSLLSYPGLLFRVSTLQRRNFLPVCLQDECVHESNSQNGRYITRFQ